MLLIGQRDKKKYENSQLKTGLLIKRESEKKIILFYDPYVPARAFIAKLLRKSPYEGRTRWREQGRKKPSGPARIAYGSLRDAN